MKILIVEPDRTMADVVSLGMQQMEHDVRVVSDAQHALDALDTFGPDVVVLELQLGKHNGVEFLYEQHSQSDWRNIPVVVHTHNRHAKDPRYHAAWQELGVKHILYKPETSITRLQKVVSSL